MKRVFDEEDLKYFWFGGFRMERVSNDGMDNGSRETRVRVGDLGVFKWRRTPVLRRWPRERDD